MKDKKYTRKYVKKAKHVDLKVFKCKQCSKTFTLYRSYTNHVRLHTDSTRFKCKTCGKCFPKKFSLDLHAWVHFKGKKPYNCNQCKVGFACESRLRHHYETVHGHPPYLTKVSRQSAVVKTKRHLCKMCGRRFPHLATLKHHMNSEHYKKKQVLHCRSLPGRKPLKCKQCGKSFAYKTCLLKHTQVHIQRKRTDNLERLVYSTAYRFDCVFCPRRFKQLNVLFNHIRVHIKERPYSCQVCGADFVQIGNMLRHCKLHTGYKPFECHRCDKSFTRKDALKAHILLHKVIVAPKRGRRASKVVSPTKQKPASVQILQTSTEGRRRPGRPSNAFKRQKAEELEKQNAEIQKETVLVQTPQPQPPIQVTPRIQDVQPVIVVVVPDQLCHFCAAGFEDEHKLEMHMNSCQLSNGIVAQEHLCDLCGKKGFENERLVEMHVTIFHNPNGALTECPECSYSCGRVKDLWWHYSRKHSKMNCDETTEDSNVDNIPQQ